MYVRVLVCVRIYPACLACDQRGVQCEKKRGKNTETRELEGETCCPRLTRETAREREESGPEVGGGGGWD